ncbi:hypothetical protein [Actinoplanes xinjiangensis]|uniref:Peptidase M23-like protein n=1 Tax=Actinoplanes xinjiangensis TaxID=512350 RepID=A0A316FGU8_9ACTN|nr:hypothetical protein [Actinoplanes xinjiangensis]PWK47000.1 hypothetical protein BC793_108114 [Actinoplanes xinjiangensis]
MAPVYSNNPATLERRSGIPRHRAAGLQSPGGDEAQPWPGARPNMYDTDWSPRRRRRKGRRRARGPGRTVSVLMAMSAVTAAAVAGVAGVDLTRQSATTPVTVDAALPPRASAPAPATRGRVRVAPVPSASATARSAAPKVARPPRPVAGLDQTQMNNAAVIVQVAQKLGLPRRAMLVAVMTGMQESSLRNLANTTVPASLDRPNEGDGADFDSLGVFQQRPSQGWGTVTQLMNPRYAANAFYERLVEVADWESRSLGDAAQAVQRSAVPDAYAKHEDLAVTVVDALL